jgi:hypothetical protein
MRKSIVQARRHSFKDPYHLGISGVSSALEYSSVCFLYTPQVGRIRTALQSTPNGATAQSKAPSSSRRIVGTNIAVQLPLAPTVHDSYMFDINEPPRFGSAATP